MALHHIPAICVVPRDEASRDWYEAAPYVLCIGDKSQLHYYQDPNGPREFVRFDAEHVGMRIDVLLLDDQGTTPVAEYRIFRRGNDVVMKKVGIVASTPSLIQTSYQTMVGNSGIYDSQEIGEPVAGPTSTQQQQQQQQQQQPNVANAVAQRTDRTSESRTERIKLSYEQIVSCRLDLCGP